MLEKRQSERGGGCSSPGKLRMKKGDCTQEARQCGLKGKLKSCMENLARNKWEKLTWMITICKCLKGVKNNQKGKEFMTHFPQSIQPPLDIYICLCLVLTKKWELSPSENQLHKHNEKLKQELHRWCISKKDTLML